MVEGNGLENRRWATIREFESHLLRQNLKENVLIGAFFFAFRKVIAALQASKTKGVRLLGASWMLTQVLLSSKRV